MKDEAEQEVMKIASTIDSISETTSELLSRARAILERSMKNHLDEQRVGDSKLNIPNAIHKTSTLSKLSNDMKILKEVSEKLNHNAGRSYRRLIQMEPLTQESYRHVSVSGRGAFLINQERNYQISQGKTTKSDYRNYPGFELVDTAICLIENCIHHESPVGIRGIQEIIENHGNDSYLETLVIAGSLIAAEIDILLFTPSTESE